jgi:hypothetical protein
MTSILKDTPFILKYCFFISQVDIWYKTYKDYNLNKHTKYNTKYNTK